MDGGDTGDGARLCVLVPGLQVSVSEGQEPPGHGEEHPGAEEGRGEDEERVLPLQVHHGSEDVLQEAALRQEQTNIALSRSNKLCPAEPETLSGSGTQTET